jgi:hypothetical protein
MPTTSSPTLTKKSRRICAPAAALILATTIPATSFADIPLVDPVGRPARILCGNTAGGQQVFAAHADKIIFTLTGALAALQQADQAALDNVPRDTELDIKVLDDPRTIADLKGKVLSFIRAVDSAVARAAVKIVDVEYAMVCPTAAGG